MTNQRKGDIPTPIALLAIFGIITILSCGIMSLWILSRSATQDNQKRDSPILDDDADKGSDTDLEEISPPTVTLYVRVPSDLENRDEVDVYLSLEIARQELTLDLEYVVFNVCDSKMCTWQFGPTEVDYNSWVYLTAYNNHIAECEIIVNGARLDAAHSAGSIASCSGNAR